MAFQKIVPYYFEFTLDGDTHVGHANGYLGDMEDPESPAHATMDGKDFTKRHILRMHPKMTLVALDPMKDSAAVRERLAKRAAELAMDPNHIPMNGTDLKEDSAKTVLAAE